MKNVIFFVMLFIFMGCPPREVDPVIIFPTPPVVIEELPVYEVASFIVKLNDDDEVENQRVRDALSGGYNVIGSCGCTPDILLYEPKDLDSDLTPVERAKEGVAAVEDVEGTSGLNVFIPLSLTKSIPTNSYESLRGNGAENNNGGDGLKFAIIDGGVQFTDPLEDKELPYNPGGFCGGFPGLNSQNGWSGHGAKVSYASLYTYQNFLSRYDLFFLDLNILREGRGSLFQALCSIRRAMSNEVDVINISWGFKSYETFLSREDSIAKAETIELFKSVLLEADSLGIPIVAAAGNDSMDIDVSPFYPASFSNEIDFLIGVGSLDHASNQVASYSNTGDLNVGVLADGAISSDFYAAEGTSYAAPRVSVGAAILHKVYEGQGVRNNSLLSRIKEYKQSGRDWEAYVSTYASQ